VKWININDQKQIYENALPNGKATVSTTKDGKEVILSNYTA
jgi:hypothetical protein